MAADDHPTRGQLVRFLETATRWYLARVRRVRNERIELAFFDKTRDMWVPRDQVDTLDAFFARRTNAWSVKRSRLTAIFYAREFERLHTDKLQEMQRVLRKAGIAFSPEDWPRGDTRIRLWKDTSVVAKDRGDTALAGLLPQWLEPFVLPSGARDPLGLQAPAERLVNQVLPGLTVFTFRAGYYGFLTWAIRHVNGLGQGALPRRMNRRELVNTLERALVLSEFVCHGVEDDSCRLIGQRSKRRVLASADGDRYRVPDSILRNQNSAGSYPLFATSLVSMGFVEDAEELKIDGFLPYRVTSLGDALANSFEQRIDPGLVPFAMGERMQTRSNLEQWGRGLCFSSIAQRKRYRDRLLQGLLCGNSHDAEKRHATVSHLFAHGLLDNLQTDTSVSQDGVSEEDAAVMEEELVGTGLSNRDVILHFYECPPHSDLRPLQALAVFELLALGLSALFRAALVNVTESGKVDIERLATAIASVGPQAATWSSAMSTARPRTVRKLVADIFDTQDVTEAASLGGALLLRILRDPMLPTVRDLLLSFAREPVELVDRSLGQQMNRSLTAVVPGLFLSMVEHHELVSRRKNRQRWLYTEGTALLRDDPRAMRLGLHALRFPQLGSIAHDIGLTREDIGLAREDSHDV